MFDPSIIIIIKVPLYALKTLGITLGFETEVDTPVFSNLLHGSWFGLVSGRFGLGFGFGKCENLGLRPRFSTLPSGPCGC